MKKAPIIAGIGIFVAILAAYPLEWLFLLGKNFHFWSELKLFSPENLTLLALAIASFSALFIQLKEKSLPLSDKIPFLFAALTIVVVGIQQLIFPFNIDFFLAGCFPAAAFLAGAAISDAWKKFFPLFIGIFAIILLIYSFLTYKFIGFPGNWNWNFTLTALAIPALFSRFCRGWKLVAFSAVAIALFIAYGTIKNPEILPRGTLLSLAGASAAMVIIAKLPKKRRTPIIAGFFVLGIIAFFLFVNFFGRNMTDYRVQLWRGSCRLAAEYPLTGCGSSRFEGLVPDFLPEEYHFVKFRADRHTHPHNEVLFMLTSFGIIGALFLLSAMNRALQADENENFNTKYMRWFVIALFIHGMVDVLLGEVHAGTLFWVSLGALNSLPTKELTYSLPPKDIRIGSIIGKITGTILLLLLVFFSVRLFCSSKLCREARLNFNNRPKAVSLLLRAEKIKATPETTYILGVHFLRAGKFSEAVEKFAELKSKFGWNGYIHSNGFAARACAELGNYPLAAEYFDLEQQRYPFSIVNSFYQLKMLQTISPEAAEQYNDDFDQLLRHRGIDRSMLIKVIHHNYLDDKLPIYREIK